MSTDNEIKVLLTAELGDLKAGMEQAAEAVAASSEAMAASAQESAAVIQAAHASVGECAEAAAARIKAMVAASLEQAAADATLGESERSLAERMGLRVEATAQQRAATQAAIQAQNAQMVGIEEFIGAQEGAAAATTASTVALDANTEAMVINGGVARELGVLAGEALRGNWKRLEGSSVTLANRMNLLQYAFTPVGLAATAAGMAVAGFAYEAFQGAEQSDRFNRTLLSTGGVLGITEGQFNDMVGSVKGLDTTAGTARDALQKLAETGRFSGDELRVAGKAAVDFAALTGQSMDQAVAAVMKLEEKPSEALLELNNQYHFLTAAQFEHVRQLEDEGYKTEAAAEAVKLFQQVHTDRLKAADDDVRGLVKWWRELKGAISDAADEIQKGFRKRTDEDQLAAVNQQIEQLRSGRFLANGIYQQGASDDDPEMRALLEKKRLLESVISNQRDFAAAAASSQRVADQTLDDVAAQEKLNHTLKDGYQLEDAIAQAKERVERIHKEKPDDKSLQGITFDASGAVTGGKQWEAILKKLQDEFGETKARAQSFHQAMQEELLQAEAADRVAYADRSKYELNFWQNKLTTLKQGSAEYAQAYAQVTALQQRVDQERQRAAERAAQQQREIDSIDLAAREQHQLSILDLKKQEIATAVQLGQVGATQELQQLAQLEQQKYQIQLSYLQQERAALVGKPAEVARINAQILALQDQHNKAMAALNQKAAVDNQRMWQQRLRPISQAFQGVINGFIQGTQTWRQASQRVLQSVAAEYLQKGVEIVVNHAANEMAKTTATTVGAEQRAAVEATAAAQSKATDAATGKSQITSAAATGAAKAYQAIVGIPYVGPILAPIAAGVAFAGIEAFAGQLASARGGWDRVPFDGAMTELHKDEMVLPADIANPMRRMAKQGGGGGGGPMVIKAFDARSFKEYLRRNPGELASGMKRAQQRGHLGGKKR